MGRAGNFRAIGRTYGKPIISATVPVRNFPKGEVPKTEDCLYLNVWTPVKGRAALPVMVYIHGGGLRVGFAREALYDGEELAKKGTVVVILNYRLGILGFFAHAELTKESRCHASGNLRPWRPSF